MVSVGGSGSLDIAATSGDGGLANAALAHGEHHTVSASRKFVRQFPQRRQRRILPPRRTAVDLRMACAGATLIRRYLTSDHVRPLDPRPTVIDTRPTVIDTRPTVIDTQPRSGQRSQRVEPHGTLAEVSEVHSRRAPQILRQVRQRLLAAPLQRGGPGVAWIPCDKHAVHQQLPVVDP
jgi:hypothetical protein